ncbi:hypothetical protein THAOC_10455 [Thalassiosira oceanica]|uniref:Uncharacterized protein n=1 Tax=Thalassiosira oceanica TaxID=159749 RepID=K0SPY8_THAOC|nr:hypothetical protein THAOC_10455 [Thalassiosira oceanica]|eukprot:EJK68368.1 hypothetical protein THAOC_10455 [Thalassiosira oceanica]
MGTTAIEEESSPPRIEGGPGEGGASTRAASGARRAPTAADEAPDPSYDANDDPTMTASDGRTTCPRTIRTTRRARRRFPWARRRWRRAGAAGQGSWSTWEAYRPREGAEWPMRAQTRHQRVFADERPSGPQ